MYGSFFIRSSKSSFCRRCSNRVSFTSFLKSRSVTPSTFHTKKIKFDKCISFQIWLFYAIWGIHALNVRGILHETSQPTASSWRIFFPHLCLLRMGPFFQLFDLLRLEILNRAFVCSLKQPTVSHTIHGTIVYLPAFGWCREICQSHGCSGSGKLT